MNKNYINSEIEIFLANQSKRPPAMKSSSSSGGGGGASFFFYFFGYYFFFAYSLVTDPAVDPAEGAGPLPIFLVPAAMSS